MTNFSIPYVKIIDGCTFEILYYDSSYGRDEEEAKREYDECMDIVLWGIHDPIDKDYVVFFRDPDVGESWVKSFDSIDIINDINTDFEYGVPQILFKKVDDKFVQLDFVLNLVINVVENIIPG